MLVVLCAICWVGGCYGDCGGGWCALDPALLHAGNTNSTCENYLLAAAHDPVRWPEEYCTVQGATRNADVLDPATTVYCPAGGTTALTSCTFEHCCSPSTVCTEPTAGPAPAPELSYVPGPAAGTFRLDEFVVRDESGAAVCPDDGVIVGTVGAAELNLPAGAKVYNLRTGVALRRHARAARLHPRRPPPRAPTRRARSQARRARCRRWSSTQTPSAPRARAA